MFLRRVGPGFVRSRTIIALTAPSAPSAPAPPAASFAALTAFAGMGGCPACLNCGRSAAFLIRGMVLVAVFALRGMFRRRHRRMFAFMRARLLLVAGD